MKTCNCGMHYTCKCMLPMPWKPRLGILQSHDSPIQWQSQDFSLKGAKLKDNINNNSKKLLIYINYKINEQFFFFEKK